jgi:hypothetical protein
MTVKLVLLKSGENIISDIKEGFYEQKLVCYILENPCKVIINGSYKILDDENGDEQYSISLTKWPILSKDETIELVPDWIVAVVSPNDKLKELYETQVLGKIKNEEHQTINFTEQSNFGESD